MAVLRQVLHRRSYIGHGLLIERGKTNPLSKTGPDGMIIEKKTFEKLLLRLKKTTAVHLCRSGGKGKH